MTLQPNYVFIILFKSIKTRIIFDIIYKIQYIISKVNSSYYVDLSIKIVVMNNGIKTLQKHQTKIILFSL